MKLLLNLIITLIVFVSSLTVSGQEFICNLQVNSQQVEGTDKSVYENMQTALTEFVNNQRWTNYDFKTAERIDCSFLINIKSRPSTDRFVATLNVVASRPIFRTAYNSNLLNYIDKDFEFEYVEFQPMEFQENSFTSNLTSVMAFYLNIILGLDFDSFSPMGGTPFFEKAEVIVNAAQNSADKGWKAFEGQRNRYWLVENLLNNSYQDLRQFSYNYHRLGLDLMSEKTEEGRSEISQSLTLLKKVYDDKPNLFLLTLILDAKRDELVNIFTEGNPREKTDAQNILKEIDPSNTSTYNKITQKN